VALDSIGTMFFFLCGLFTPSGSLCIQDRHMLLKPVQKAQQVGQRFPIAYHRIIRGEILALKQQSSSTGPLAATVQRLSTHRNSAAEIA